MTLTENFYYRHDKAHISKREYLAEKWHCSEAAAVRKAVELCANAFQ